MSRVLPIMANWRDLGVPGDHVLGVTPPARLEYLRSLVELAHGAITTGYAQTGLATDFDVSKYVAGSPSTRYVPAAQAIAAGSKSARGRYAQAVSGQSGTPLYASAYGATSGATAADEIRTASPFTAGVLTFPALGLATATVFEGASGYVATPSAAGDRAFELQSRREPYVETMDVRDVHGFALGVPGQVGDLNAI